MGRTVLFLWFAALAAAAITMLTTGAAARAAEQPPAPPPPPPCAETTDAAAPATPAPGAPCWVDADPYPFGADGEAVDTGSLGCAPTGSFGPSWNGDVGSCYLGVDSMAFRAWNRGLAAVSPVVGDASATTAFGVWLFNGTRWFPDPTFPGQSVCRGNTVLWAGKRDYWLVGGRVKNWPRLCRFDGVNFEWQPLDVPAAALSHVPVDAGGKVQAGAINTGSCLSWDNCWFAGSYGVRLHWDGTVLSDATPDLSTYPALRGDTLAAVTRTDSAGSRFGFAVGTTGGPLKGQQLPRRSDGSPPPELFRTTGDPFDAMAFSPATIAQPDDPYRTDLVAVDSDSAGHVWVAGNPVGYRAELSPPGFFASPTERRATSTAEPSPLAPVGYDGSARTCAALGPDTFQYVHQPNGSDAYLWSSIGVLPGGDTAVAGGQLRPATAGATLNDDGQREPLLEQVACNKPPQPTRFRMPDPFTADHAAAGLVPANRTGLVTSVAANAVNDAWAATSKGVLKNPDNPAESVLQRPHLYRLTDTTPPKAVAGDDNEPRPLVFEPDPPIFVEAPPDPEPEPLPPETVTQPAPPVQPTVVRLKAAIYRVRAHVTNTCAKPKRKNRGNGGCKPRLTLEISFRIRRPVTIGVEALRHRRVVSRSGMHRFRGKRGTLQLALERKQWPTRIRFVTPRADKRLTETPQPEPTR